MSIPIRMVVVFIAGSTTASVCKADRLYLTNGQIKDGKVIKRDATGVDFRTVTHDGKLTFVKRYDAADILKVEFGEESAETAKEGETREPPAASPEAAEPSISPTTKKIEDKPAFLKDIMTKLKAEKLDAAVADLTHLVRECNESELADLSVLSKKESGLPLDELLATNRLQASIKKAASGVWRKLEPTGFERPALVEELRKTIDDFRGKKVGGTSIESEIENPDGYKGQKEDARAFSKHITLTLNLVEEIQRLDKGAEDKGKTVKESRESVKKADKAGAETDERKEKDAHEESAPSDEKKSPNGAKSKTRSPSDNKGQDEWAEFKAQLKVLQKAVQKSATGGSALRRDRDRGAVRGAEPSKDDDDVGEDRTPRRRGTVRREDFRRSRRGLGDEGEEPPIDNQQRRGRRLPPQDEQEGDDRGAPPEARNQSQQNER